MRFALTLSLVAAPLVAQALSPAHIAHAHRRSPATGAGNQVQKRSFSGFGTWYDVGLGACGWFNNPGDFIIAMNSNQFPQDSYPSSICGKQVGINGPAGYAVATVADECPDGGGNCHYGDMDMSKGLFTAVFGSLDVGKGPITWDWLDGSGGGNTGNNGGNNGGGGNNGNNGGNNGGGGDGGQQSQAPPQDPSTTPPPQDPSPTPSPSPTPTPTPTSSSSQSTKSQTSSSASVSDTAHIEDVNGDNLTKFNQFFVQLQGTMYKGLDTE